MKIAKWSFLIAGIFGFVSMASLLFSAKTVSVQQPEFYYGFVFLTICWQITYIIIATSPIRYRLIMIPAILTKASGTVALVWLYLAGRVSAQWIGIGAVDGIFAVLFCVGFISTARNLKNAGEK